MDGIFMVVARANARSIPARARTNAEESGSSGAARDYEIGVR
jgi:hypothetical protein